PDTGELAAGLDPLDPSDDAGAGASIDTDGDGIPDYAEVNGVADAMGHRVYSDPLDPDTDHDGLVDGSNVDLVPSDPRVANWTARGILIERVANGKLRAFGEVDASASASRADSLVPGVPDGWAVLYS